MAGAVQRERRISTTIPRPDAPAHAAADLIRDVEAIAGGTQEAAGPAPETFLAGGLPERGVIGLAQTTDTVGG
jgi:hypothetical protein